MFPPRETSVSFVEPNLTDVNLLAEAYKVSRSVKVDKSRVENWLSFSCKYDNAMLDAVLRVVSLLPERFRNVSAVKDETSTALNEVLVIEREVRAVFPVSVTPVKPSGVS